MNSGGYPRINCQIWPNPFKVSNSAQHECPVWLATGCRVIVDAPQSFGLPLSLCNTRKCLPDVLKLSIAQPVPNPLHHHSKRALTLAAQT
jgi:hypothetical protein